MTLLPMSKKEVDRYDIISRLIRKELKEKQVSNLLYLSVRQVRRLKKKVEQSGVIGLIHGNRGKTSHNKIPTKERKEIINLLHKHYYDFGPTFAMEKLDERHGIIRDSKTIRQIMIDEGLWKPRKKGKKKKFRQWRQPRACYGEMVQFDGSYEYWFEDRNKKCCLLAAIDDATGKVVHAVFDDDEGVFPVFKFWKSYFETHGKPESVYLDKFSTYKMNSRFAKENHDLKTQFQRAMDELKIESITAHSPQAKGRVERLFNTLQDRLIKELRLQNISDKETANQFLKNTYIAEHNRRFTKEPRQSRDKHRQLAKTEQKNLPCILSKHTKRSIQNDYTISFNNKWYQITQKQPVTIQKKDSVIMEEWLNGSIHIRLHGKELNYVVLPDWAKRAPGRKRQTEKMWFIPANTSNLGQAVGKISRQIVKKHAQR